MKSIQEFIEENKALSGYKALDWSEAQVKSFWDFESIYDEKYFTYHYGDKIVELIEPYISGQKSILDYGAGKGFLSAQLLANGYQTATFDLSDESCRKLPEKFGDKSRFLGAYSGDTIENQDGKFDAVIMIEVVEHLDDPTREKVLKQIHRLLSDKGIFILSSPNNENLENEFICNPGTKEIFHRWQHVYSWHEESLSKEVEKYGFKVLKSIQTNMKWVGNSPILALKKLFAKKSRLNSLFVIAQKE